MYVALVINTVHAILHCHILGELQRIRATSHTLEMSVVYTDTVCVCVRNRHTYNIPIRTAAIEQSTMINSALESI